MNRLQYLLTKLAEEANEVGQIALKTQQFGVDEGMPGQPFTNAERTHQELNDLFPKNQQHALFNVFSIINKNFM